MENKTQQAEKPAEKKVNCSFCGKSQDNVDRIIAGPGIYICDQCVDMCAQILAECPLSGEYQDFFKDTEEDTPEIIDARHRIVYALQDIPKKQLPLMATILESISSVVENVVEDTIVKVAAEMRKVDKTEVPQPSTQENKDEETED